MAGVSGVRGGAAARISTAKNAEVKESARAGQAATETKPAARGASAGASAEVGGRVDAQTVRDSRRAAAADPTAKTLRAGLEAKVSSGAVIDASDAGTGRVPEALRDAVRPVAERVWGGISSVADTVADTVKDTVRSGVDSVERGVQSAAERVQEGIQRVGELYGDNAGPQPVKEDVVEKHRQQLKELGPGDAHIEEGGAQVTIKGIKGSAKAGREIKVNEDGTVSVTIDANGAVGLKGKLSSVGGGEATVGGGGKVEYQFANKEEAAKALEMMDRGRMESNSPVQMGGMRYESHLTDKEKAFLGSRIKSVEFRGTEAGELALELGLKKKQTGIATLGVGGKLAGSEEEALRINFKDGKPDSITHRSSLKGSGEGFAGLGIEGLQTSKGEATGGVPVAKASREVTVDSETTYKLPNLDGDRLLSDPAGALRDSLPLAEEKSSMKVTVVDKGGVLGNGVERQREYEVEGKWDDIERSGALGVSIFGDRARAEQLGRQHNVDVKAPKETDYVSTGLDIEPGLDVGIYGGGFAIKSVTRDKNGDGAGQA